MDDQSASPAAADECARKREEIQARQSEFDQLWLQMSSGNTAGAARYRDLRHLLDELRADYGRTCGELTESSSLPPNVVADWRS